MISPIHLHRLRLGALVVGTLLAVTLAIRAVADTGDYLGVEWPALALPGAAGPEAPEPLAIEEFTPDRKRALTPEEATAINLASPLVRDNPPAPGFNGALALAPEDFARSLECMTAAIYYEAASEPLIGQQAVAQVVLNRLRHPRYPKSVCAVVYQGSERSTGCQFTFTCDGALARQPNPAVWERARMVARAALSGMVSIVAGQATHYHTLAIVPVWAPSLQKVAIVGHHVFYRMPGDYGPWRPAEPAVTTPIAAPSAPATVANAVPPQIPALATAVDEIAPLVAANPAPLQTAPNAEPDARKEAAPRSFFGQSNRRRPNLAIPNP